MKRLVCLIALLILFALPFTALAGHSVVGSGHVIYCECTTEQYKCFDDDTGELLPMCGGFAASIRQGNKVK